MKQYKVSANPKGGTCYQFVDADNEEEAVEKAKANPNGWKHSNPRDAKDWFYKAFEFKPRSRK